MIFLHQQGAIIYIYIYIYIYIKHDRVKAQWLNSIRRFFHNLTCLFQRHQFVKRRLLFRNQVQKERDKFLVVCLHVPHHVTISFQEWMDPGFVFSNPRL